MHTEDPSLENLPLRDDLVPSHALETRLEFVIQGTRLESPQGRGFLLDSVCCADKCLP